MEAPIISFHLETNNTVITTCWVIDATKITFIFHTKLAFWIIRSYRIFSSSDGFWIFFRFRKVNRNFQVTVFSRCFISNILCNGFDFHIIIAFTKVIKISNCLLWVRLISIPEVTIDNTRAWCNQVHELSSDNILLFIKFTYETSFYTRLKQLVFKLNQFRAISFNIRHSFSNQSKNFVCQIDTVQFLIITIFNNQSYKSVY